MTRDEAKRIMAMVRVLWPHSVLYPEGQATLALDVWAGILDDVSLTAATAAVQALAHEAREFPPPVGVIGSKAADLVAASRGELPPDAGDAWGVVEKLMLCYDPPATSGYPHPAIATAVERLGWPMLRELAGAQREGLASVRDIATVRAQFRDVYREVVAAQAAERHMPRAVRAELTAGDNDRGITR
jgi:hypothetical protein